MAAADAGLIGLGAGGEAPVGTDAGDAVNGELMLGPPEGAGGSHDAEPEAVGYLQERQLSNVVLPFWGLYVPAGQSTSDVASGQYDPGAHAVHAGSPGRSATEPAAQGCGTADCAGHAEPRGQPAQGTPDSGEYSPGPHEHSPATQVRHVPDAQPAVVPGSQGSHGSPDTSGRTVPGAHGAQREK